MREENDAELRRLADLIFEVGMLRHTPRTGWPFLGSNEENVAEHSFRTAVIGYLLARRVQADWARVVLICLFHDVHEARTGDFNYVYHRYNTCRAREALRDAVHGSGLEDDILSLFDAFEAKESLEAKIARDADQLDLIAGLYQELARGNRFAQEWLDSALQRLETGVGKEFAAALGQTDPNRWWYNQVPKEWWVHHK